MFTLRTYRALMLLCSLAVLVGASNVPVVSQDKEPSASRNNELKKIDAKSAKVDEIFLKSAFEFAAEYEKAGDLARAIDYLQAMSLVKPGVPAIEEKLKLLRDEVMNANNFTFKHEPSTSWGNPVAFVKAGKPFRIAVQGTYKFSLTTLLGPDGFPEDNGQTELIDNVPLGKLVGVIVQDPSRPSRKAERRIAPFEIGTGRNMNPPQSGYLFLKVNVPPQAKPSGTPEVGLSGYVLAPDAESQMFIANSETLKNRNCLSLLPLRMIERSGQPVTLESLNACKVSRSSTNVRAI